MEWRVVLRPGNGGDCCDELQSESGDQDDDDDEGEMLVANNMLDPSVAVPAGTASIQTLSSSYLTDDDE